MKKLLTVAAATALLLVSTQLLAHARLTATVPADGSMVTQSPETIALQFNKPVRLMKISVTGDSSGDIQINFAPAGAAASDYQIPVPALAMDSYQVSWIAMGADGHKMSGSFSFTQHGTK